MKKEKNQYVPTIYIAGPMRGYPEFNFPAFDQAAKRFRKLGWKVINPAELDRINHAHEYSSNFGTDFLREAMRRDLEAICGCNAIALLPEWEDSSGTFVELTLARFLGLEFWDARKMTLMPYVTHSKNNR